MLLHCVVFWIAEGDNGEEGTEAARGRESHVISSAGRERIPTEIEGWAMLPGKRRESE